MNRFRVLGWISLLPSLLGLASGGAQSSEPRPAERSASPPADNAPRTALATFGGGCFWCVEAVFEEVEGVLSVESGYSGGLLPNPTYQQVSTGRTGHAEVCQIRFDPAKVSYTTLLEIFWKTHDPTTLNRQGPDVGTQYRSVIFYHDDGQKALAEKYKRALNDSGAWRRPIVTAIEPFQAFYRAESYHQEYFRNNPSQAYCRSVIRPKMEKFRKAFPDKQKQAP